MVVGHGKAVSRNEKARALAGDRTAAARTAAQAGRQAIGSAKAAEETFHRGTRLERRVFVVATVVLRGSLLVDLDTNRNHRRLHPLDNVGKANRPLDLADFIVDLRLGRAGENIEIAGRQAEAVSGNTEASDHRPHQREPTRR